MIVVIEYKGRVINFDEKVTFREYFEIQEAYEEPTGIENEGWWLKKSDFGQYILRKFSSYPELEIHEEDWEKFHPALNLYFPSPEEYYGIISNIRFLHGFIPLAIENKYFLKYLLMRDFGKITFKEIENIPVKDALMLYYYCANNNILDVFDVDVFQKREEKKNEMYR